MSRQSAVLMAFVGALLLAMLLEGAPLPLTLLAPIAPHHNGTVSDGNQVISAELIESRIVDFRVAYHEILESTKKESHRLSEQTLFLEEMANRYITKYLAENLQPMPLQYRVFRVLSLFLSHSYTHSPMLRDEVHTLSYHSFRNLSKTLSEKKKEKRTMNTKWTYA